MSHTNRVRETYTEHARRCLVSPTRSNALTTATILTAYFGCSYSGDRFFADRFPAEFAMTRKALLLTRSTVLPFIYGCYLQH